MTWSSVLSVDENSFLEYGGVGSRVFEWVGMRLHEMYTYFEHEKSKEIQVGQESQEV